MCVCAASRSQFETLDQFSNLLASVNILQHADGIFIKSVGLISHVRLERWAVCVVLCAKSVFPALFSEAVMKRAAGE